MKKNELIATINGIEFYYLSWNIHYNCHIIYTHNENFHVEKNEDDFPNYKDCERIYDNFYR